jgi:hypothetical protein
MIVHHKILASILDQNGHDGLGSKVNGRPATTGTPVPPSPCSRRSTETRPLRNANVKTADELELELEAKMDTGSQRPTRLD